MKWERWINMRIDVMVDLETLGNKATSTIFQISASGFDIATGLSINSFNGISDISKNDKMNVTGDTIKWWLDTDAELLKTLLNKGEGSSDMLLIEFFKWLNAMTKDNDVYLWGNGILFDNNLLRTQFEALGMSYPIHFRNDRDVRTIVELAALKTGKTVKELQAEYNDPSLTAHNAMDDVYYQIALVSGCYGIIVGDK